MKELQRGPFENRRFRPLLGCVSPRAARIAMTDGASSLQQIDPLEPLTRGVHHQVAIVPLDHRQRSTGYSCHLQGAHAVHQRLCDEAVA